VFNEGDLVLLDTRNLPLNTVSAVGSNKLKHRFIGPFAVLSRHGAAYAIDLPKSMTTHSTFYVCRLKRYHDPQEAAGRRIDYLLEARLSLRHRVSLMSGRIVQRAVRPWRIRWSRVRRAPVRAILIRPRVRVRLSLPIRRSAKDLGLEVMELTPQDIDIRGQSAAIVILPLKSLDVAT
jgi:hypothetical protein